jgi:uncharacterized YccA/Bax inhibitor family protein
MQTANPILARIDREAAARQATGGPGFAYDEGRSAIAQAQTGAPAPATATSPAGMPPSIGTTRAVTFTDVMAKSGVLFVLAVLGAVVGWQLANTGIGLIVVFGAMIGALVLGLVNAFKREVSPALVIGYALVSGVMLGAVSNWYNTLALANEYEGLVLQAVLATMTTFGIMLLLYGTGIVKVNNKFMKVMIAAMAAYFVIAIASFVAAMFGVGGGWGFYGVGTFGLLLCVAGVLLAAFSLMLDFEAIKQGVAMGLPERESWRLSFGLLVTIVWLYLEILRFLAIIASGRD